jgi:hypothetical protein
MTTRPAGRRPRSILACQDQRGVETGTTQLRVCFTLDDHDDLRADYIGYYPGDNSTPANRPHSW